MMNRNEEINKAMIDIDLDSNGDENIIFDLAADHFGSDDDAHYMIHSYAYNRKFHEATTSPRSLAFLRLLKHAPNECPECD